MQAARCLTLLAVVRAVNGNNASNASNASCVSWNEDVKYILEKAEPWAPVGAQSYLEGHVANNCSIDLKDKDGSSVLFWAVRAGEPDYVKMALSYGAHIDQWDGMRLTPVLTSARSGYFEVLKLLLENGANPNAVDPYGLTATWWAADMGYGGVVELLLAKGAATHHKDHRDLSVLGIAAWRGFVGMVRKLIQHGADTDILDKKILNYTGVAWVEAACPAPCLWQYGNKSVVLRDVVDSDITTMIEQSCPYRTKNNLTCFANGTNVTTSRRRSGSRRLSNRTSKSTGQARSKSIASTARQQMPDVEPIERGLVENSSTLIWDEENE